MNEKSTLSEPIRAKVRAPSLLGSAYTGWMSFSLDSRGHGVKAAVVRSAFLDNDPGKL